MRYVTLTNALIQDKALQYSSKMVAYALAVARRKDGTTRQTISQLCAMTGLCRATVQQGLRELEEAGYLTRQRTYRFSLALARPVRDTTCYKLLRAPGQPFTMLPLDLLGYALTPAAFGVLLYLYRCAGQEGRAFPSRRRIGRFLDMAKSTVGAALAALKDLGLFIRCRCLRRRGDFSMNSYHMTNMAIAGASSQEAPAISSAMGVGRNLNYASQEQDNGGFYLEGKKNRSGLIRQFEQFWRQAVFPGETLGPPGKQTKFL